MTLQCCLNGSRDTEEHPAVPATALACAAAAQAAVAAGARDLHIHPRTADGRDSLAPEDVQAWLSAVRAEVSVPVGVTTGAWAWTGRTSPAAAIRDWQVLPDHASVNWHEPGSREVCEALYDRAVSVNVGLWTIADAESWLDTSWPSRTDLILLELADLADQTGVAQQLLDLVRPAGLPILLHGEGRSAWPMVHLARASGVQTRIGLEDVLYGPAGEEIADNAELVRLALVDSIKY